MNRKGKRVTALFGLVAIAVLTVSSFVACPWLVDEYHIRQLDSEDLEVRIAAAQALGRTKCFRAVSRLIASLERPAPYRYFEQRHDVTRLPREASWEVASAICYIGVKALPAVSEAALRSKENSRLQMVKEALERQANNALGQRDDGEPEDASP